MDETNFSAKDSIDYKSNHNQSAPDARYGKIESKSDLQVQLQTFNNGL